MRAADLAKLVRNPRRRGEWIDCLCPGHDDHAPSLSFADGDVRVILECRAGCSDEQIAAGFGIKVADLFFKPARRNGRGPHRPGTLTLDAFAKGKGLPRDFLAACGVVERGAELQITYRLADGSLAPRQRRRWALAAKDGSAWTRGAGALVPYGLEHLDDAREKGALLIVEGETDWLTARLHNIPCLGIPGASMAKVLEAGHLRAIGRVDVVQEPGRGGETLVAGVAARLHALGYTGQAFTLVLPVKHLNDLHRTAGADFAMQFQAAKDHAAPLALVADDATAALGAVDDSIEWSPPKPIPSDLAPVPAFDVDRMMPASFAPWVADIADRAQCPADFLGVAALVTAGAVVGRSITIRPKQHDDWTVVPNLWGIAIGRPGIMKTPALQEALRPLGRLVAEARDDHKARMAEHEFERAAAEARRDVAKKKLKNAVEQGRATDDVREAFKDPLPQAPTERRYLVNDATVEKLGALLNENPNGLLHFRDELVGWVRTMDREGHENDRAFFCEAWNGDGPYTYDRIGRGTLHIKAACVSILGGMTPGPLHGYLREAFAHGARDDGLIQRFQLMVYPDVAREWRNVDRRPETEAKRRAFDAFKALAAPDLDELQTHRPEHDGGLPFLRFTPEAQACFDAWRAKLEGRLRAGDEHPVVVSHLAKYRSLMPSLALLFHLVECVDCCVSGPVSLAAADRAVLWCEYLEAHARRVYQSITASRRLAATAIAGKLRAGKLDNPFRARDITESDWSELTDPAEVQAGLALLEHLHWVRSVEVRPSGKGGRPTLEYHVNPAVVADQ